MANFNSLDDFAKKIQADSSIAEDVKSKILKNLHDLSQEKVHILVTGATGCGKSSTINALFGDQIAKVGQGADPETMAISRHDYNNIVLYDSPGLGDGKEADLRHAKNITDLLYKKDEKDRMLIDLVLVILDGSSRDLGTSFELINNVVIPCFNGNNDRLLVAINQSDVAMKGRFWNYDENKPEPPLVDFLEEKVMSCKKRIKDSTGVDVEPIYYAAGYKDGSDEQKPYNLSKLLLMILHATKNEKRAVFINDINNDAEMWTHDDGLKDYRSEVKETMFASLSKSVMSGVAMGAEIGGQLFGAPGKILGAVAGGVIGAFLSVFG
jgi:predicted GTPase